LGVRVLAHDVLHKAIKRTDTAFLLTQTKELGPVNIECGDISPCPASFVLVFHLRGRARLSGISRMSPSTSLHTGLLIGTQNKLILFHWLTVQNPVIEVENTSGFSPKTGISGENPAAVGPWFDGILIEPAPHGATADGSYQTRLPAVIENIFTAPARKGTSKLATMP